MTRRFTLALLLSFGSAAVAPAQHADERDAERIEVPDVRDTSGKRPDFKGVAGRITDRTNAFRKTEDRGHVAPDEELTAAARYFADYMARNDEYGHTADGKTPSARAEGHGYAFCIVLENIAYAFDSRGFEAGPLADQFFTGWRESPGHRRNMLDPDVTQTGVAVARSEKTGHYYAVQMFGRPKAAAIEFKIENRGGMAFEYTLGGKPFTLPPRYIRTHTVCRPPEVTFMWPSGKKGGPAVKPTSGERLVVTEAGGEWSVGKD